MSDSLPLHVQACQSPLYMGFSRQEYWSGLLFPSRGNLPNSGVEPRSPALQADSLPSEPPGKLKKNNKHSLSHIGVGMGIWKQLR